MIKLMAYIAGVSVGILGMVDLRFRWKVFWIVNIVITWSLAELIYESISK